VTDNKLPASIVAVMGASGSGKSSSIVAALQADKGSRRIIFDPGGDYAAFGDPVDDVRAALRVVVKAGAGAFRLVFNPSFDAERARRQFSDLCELAYAAGDVLTVADELEGVMSPSWSPPGWALLVLRGRKRGVRIIGASQRPAGIEKRFWSLATVIRSGRLNYADDAATVARVLMVEPRDVLALADLDFIQRSVRRPVVQWGRIAWARGRPVESILREKNLLPDAPA